MYGFNCSSYLDFVKNQRGVQAMVFRDEAEMKAPGCAEILIVVFVGVGA
jgi:hypothetical protein